MSGRALQHAAAPLRADLDLANAALAQDPGAMQFVARDLRRDLEAWRSVPGAGGRRGGSTRQ